MDVGAQPCPAARHEPQHSQATAAGPLPDTSAAQPVQSCRAVAAASSLRGVAGSGAALHASAAVHASVTALAAAAAGGSGPGPGLAQPGALGAAAQLGHGCGRAAVDDAVSQLRAARSRAVEAQQRERRLREAAEAQAREAEDQRWAAVEGQLEAEVRQQEAEAAAASLRDQLQAAEGRAAEAARETAAAGEREAAAREEAAGLRIALAAAQLGAQAAASGLQAQLQAAREDAEGARQQAQEAQAQTASLQGQLAACQEQLAAAQSQADPLRLEVATLRDTCSRECSLKREHQKRAVQLQNQATAAQFRVGELMQQVTALEARRREAERATAQAQREAARERAAAAEARSAVQQSEERQQQLQSEACRLSGALRQSELELSRAVEITEFLQHSLERERQRANALASGASADVELRRAGVQLPPLLAGGPRAAALSSPRSQAPGGGLGSAVIAPTTPAQRGSGGVGAAPHALPLQPPLLPSPASSAAAAPESGGSRLAAPGGLEPELTAAKGPSGSCLELHVSAVEGPSGSGSRAAAPHTEGPRPELQQDRPPTMAQQAQPSLQAEADRGAEAADALGAAGRQAPAASRLAPPTPSAGPLAGWGLAARASAASAEATAQASPSGRRLLLTGAAVRWLQQRRQLTARGPDAQTEPASQPVPGAQQMGSADQPSSAAPGTGDAAPRTPAQLAALALQGAPAQAQPEQRSAPPVGAQAVVEEAQAETVGDTTAEAGDAPAAAPGAAGSGRGSEEGSGPQPMEGLEGGSGAQAQAAMGPPAAGGAGGAPGASAQGPAGEAEGNISHPLPPLDLGRVLATGQSWSAEQGGPDGSPCEAGSGTQAEPLQPSQGGGKPAATSEAHGQPGGSEGAGLTRPLPAQSDDERSSKRARRERPSGARGDGAQGTAADADGPGASGPKPTEAVAAGSASSVDGNREPGPMAPGAGSSRAGQGMAPPPAAHAEGGGPLLPTAPSGSVGMGGAEGPALGCPTGPSSQPQPEEEEEQAPSNALGTARDEREEQARAPVPLLGGCSSPALGAPATGGPSGAQAPGANGLAGLAEDTKPRGLAAAGAQELPLGVAHTPGSRFRAQIQVQGKVEHLGIHDTPEEAARAFDRAAVQRHNERQCSRKLQINFPSEWSNLAVRPVVPRATLREGHDRGGARLGSANTACGRPVEGDDATRGGDGGAGDESGAGWAPGSSHAGLGLSGLPRGVKQMPGGRYFAQIRRDGKQQYLGTWDTLEQAGRSFDRAAVERYNGGYAKLELNYPSEWSDPAQGRPVVPRVQPAQGGGPGEAGAQPGAAPGAAGSGLDGWLQAQPGPDPASGPRPAPRKRSAAQCSGGPSQGPQPGDGPGGKRGRRGPGAAEGDTE
ncbi:hypothetical protein HYH03_002313 [Edaphochlamys debaryana]|uniref:AP2/ERF domain-containing protein n=1 Tax=Edaphochlamys debaryana TaxID=47281 RepID=A0A835YE95_9CHLO|nr:hypothetical protein HYH03_002313 [Edaphochlamys debaryana]|eukprot:KAG2500032.1 hypothetical protein HYH03_002313 [Edaphochlamys debaryana]